MDFRQVLALARKKDHLIYKYFDGKSSAAKSESSLKLDKLPNAVAEYIGGSTSPRSRPHKSHIPLIPDLVCHLKLLRAFDECKKTVLGDDGDAPTREKRWQVFVLNAMRRFIIFVSAIHQFSSKEFIRWYPGDDEGLTFKNGIRKDRNFMSRMVAILPPLDVVMVWHAFLLSPRTMYDHFMRSQFMQFALFPMPLKFLSDAIDNETFVYDPPIHFKQAYHMVVLSYTDNMRDLIYHVDSLDQCQHFMDVYCPSCHEILVENVPWTLDDNTGFADLGFTRTINISYCQCNFSSKTITHDELRRRQLYADIQQPTTLAGSYKYYSSIISPHQFRHRDVMKMNFNLKRHLKEKLQDLRSMPLAEFVTSLESLIEHRKLNLLLRNYLLMNPIHCTVPGDKFEIWEDLVGAVLRQERFTQAMSEIDWLHKNQIRQGLKELVIRYSRFFSLLTRYEQLKILVPTLDIDLVWHTHQLLMYFYFEDCMHTSSGFVIDHDDKVESGRLDGGFTATAQLYKSNFNEPYLLCFCDYCVVWRQKLRRGILSRVLFITKMSDKEAKFCHHPLYLPQTGPTHMSLHNAVELPLLLASTQRQATRSRYPNTIKLPWEDTDVLYYGTDPNHFVIPPAAPFLGDNIHVFGNGLCCTVRDYGATCHGVVSMEDYLHP